MQQSVVPGPGGHRRELPALLPLYGRQSSVPYSVPAFSTLGIASVAGGFGSFPLLWGDIAVMDGDVKVPALLDVKSICPFRIMFYDQLI